MLGIGRTLVSITFARIAGGSEFQLDLILPGFANDELKNLQTNNLRVTENLRAQSRRLGDHAWRAWTSWAAVNSCCVGVSSCRELLLTMLGIGWTLVSMTFSRAKKQVKD